MTLARRWIVALVAVSAAGALLLAAWFVLPDAQVRRGQQASSASDDSGSAAAIASVAAGSDLELARDDAATGESSALERSPVAKANRSGQGSTAKEQDSVHLFGQVRGLEARYDVEGQQVIWAETRAQAAGSESPTDSHVVSRGFPLRVREVRIFDDKLQEQTARIDAKGDYSFAHLHPGRWGVSVHDQGRLAYFANIDLAADEREHRHDIEVKPERRICIRMMTTEGGDLTSALAADSTLRLPITIDVIATNQAPGSTWEPTPTSHGPQYLRLQAKYAPARFNPSSAEAKAGCSGVLVTDAQVPFHVSVVLHGFVLGTQPVSESTRTLSFVIDPESVRRNIGTVRLRLVDPLGGNVPEDCSVVLHDPWMEKSAGTIPADGQIEFTGLTPGSMTLSIRAEGCEDFEQRVDVAAGTVTELGTIALDRWCRIFARVLDPDGRPAGVFFNAFPLERFESERQVLSKRCFRASPDDGELVIGTLGHGRYLLRSIDETWGGSVVADTTGGDVRGLVIHVARRVEVTVRAPIAAPQLAELYVTDRAGIPVLEMQPRDKTAFAIRLAPGAYTVKLAVRDAELARTQLVVGDEPMEIALPSWK
jgi:hypothetical protein